MMSRVNPILLAGLLLFSAGPAIADLPDPDAFLLDTTIVSCLTPGYQWKPSAAFDGNNYVVVWNDDRDGWHIYGGRVTQDGTMLDTVGFPLSAYVSVNCRPVVARGGENSLAVWYDQNGQSSVVYGARVDPDGRLLDPGGFRISSSQEHLARYPAVAFDGSNWLVVWQNGDYGSLHGQRVDTSGQVMDTTSFTIAPLSWLDPGRVSFDGTNYVVVWRRLFAGIECVRVSPDGQIVQPGVIAVSSSDSADAAVVSSGPTNSLVVWHHTQRGILGARLSPAGVVIDTMPITISRSHNPSQPTVSFNGTDYLVAWEAWDDYRYESYAARVTSAGRVLDTLAMRVYSDSGGAYMLDIACCDSNALVVWFGLRRGDVDILGNRISPDGTVLDSNGFHVTAGTQCQSDADVSYGGDAYLAVWTENRKGDDSTDIYGVRASVTGALLDPRPFPIAARRGAEQSACAAAGDSCYLVAWEHVHGDSSDICCSRVSFAGAILDSGTKLTSSSYAWDPAVGFGKSTFLAAYLDNPLLLARAISQSGALGDPFAIDSGWSYPPHDPAIAFNGTDYLLTWLRETGPMQDTTCVFCVRTDSSGAPLDSAPRLVARNVSQTGARSVASDLDGYLVVWASSYPRNILGCRVSADGQVLDSTGFLISRPAYGGAPAVGFDGQYYQAVWVEMEPEPPWDLNLHGAMVSPSGAVIDTFPVATGPGRQSEPALAQGPDGQMLLVYSGFADSINGRPANTTRIWGKLSPFVGLADAHQPARAAQPISARPNPFRSSLLIHSTTGPLDHSTTYVHVYDIGGRRVASSARPGSALVATKAGYLWQPGREAAAGVYVIRITTPERTATARVVFAP